MKSALMIVTYVPERAPSGTRRRLPAALESLHATHYRGALTIVDDGSTDEEYMRYLARLSQDYRVIRREKNGGIARAKNSCLRVFAESQAQVGFIAEDDIAFLPGWLEAYVDAHRATGIQHFSWAWDNDPSDQMNKTACEIHGHPVVSTSLVNGVFLSLTPNVIHAVGGFRVLPAKWGHEHTNWTKRIIKAGLTPFFADICDSNRYITINPHGEDSVIPRESREAFARLNEPDANDLSVLYCPLIE